MTTEAPPPPDDAAGGEGAPALPKRRKGRPRRLEQAPGLTEDICAMLRDGDPIEVACDMVGVAESSFYEWAKKGDEDLAAGRDTPEAEFSEATKRATAEFCHAALRAVRRGGDGWQGEAWALERRKRKHFARPAAIELSGPEGRPLQVETKLIDVRNLPLDELERLARGEPAKGEGGA